MNKQIKAKTCPFCSLGPVHVIKIDKKGYQAECINCAARGPGGWLERGSALRAWNEGDPVPYIKREVQRYASPEEAEQAVGAAMRAFLEDVYSYEAELKAYEERKKSTEDSVKVFLGD